MGLYCRLDGAGCRDIGLRDVEGHWELNLIGTNLNYEISAGNCTNFNGTYQNLPGTSITGSPTSVQDIAGVDEAVCFVERGHQLWLEFICRM